MTSLFSKIEPNVDGKDYICSDIHGHFSILQQALNDIGFDERSDRLFCLGVTNSCLTHVLDILEAGGTPIINRHKMSYARFFAKNGFKRDPSKPILVR
jgi:hypothetical protein